MQRLVVSAIPEHFISLVYNQDAVDVPDESILTRLQTRHALWIGLSLTVSFAFLDCFLDHRDDIGKAIHGFFNESPHIANSMSS